MEAKETKQMAGMETEEACCRTERTPAERKKLLTRLKTVEGQIIRWAKKRPYSHFRLTADRTFLFLITRAGR